MISYWERSGSVPRIILDFIIITNTIIIIFTLIFRVRKADEMLEDFPVESDSTVYFIPGSGGMIHCSALAEVGGL